MRNADNNHTHGRFSRGGHLHNGVYQETAKPMISAGTASVPSLGVNASTNVVVTLKLPMADTNYQAVPVLTGTTQLLGSLSITASTILTASTVQVTVQNTGLLTLAGATALVVALSNT